MVSRSPILYFRKTSIVNFLELKASEEILESSKNKFSKNAIPLQEKNTYNSKLLKILLI